MEITKGENANLAGMEPRCPKCGSNTMSKGYVRPEGEQMRLTAACCSCKWQADIYGHPQFNLADLAQFFRSPAPTPPLDVEAEKIITEIRERESKATKGPWFWRKCYEIGRRHWAIKSPESEADGRVVGVMGTLAFDDFTPPDKWHADPNNQFIAHARLDIPFLLEQISLLRRHIASPAQPEKPWIEEFLEHVQWLHDHAENRIKQVHDSGILKGSSCIPADSQLNAYLQGERDVCTELLARAREFKKAAQPEKRDEWVSVDERLPSADDPNEYVLVCWKKEWRGRKLSKVDEDTSVASPSGIDPCFIPYFLARHFHQATHWQPLPAPPQSGKEGQ